jgi:hypothetical protein
VILLKSLKNNFEASLENQQIMLSKPELCNICLFEEYINALFFGKPAKEWGLARTAIQQTPHQIPWDEMCRKDYLKFLMKIDKTDNLGERINFLVSIAKSLKRVEW